MNLTQSLFRQILVPCSLAILLLSGVEFPLTFSKAAGQGLAPPRGANKGAGGRSPCPAAVADRVLTALVDESAYTQPLLTTQERPTLLFYVPFSRTWNIASNDGQTYNITSAEFELLDKNQKSVLKNQKIVFSLPDKPGIVKIALPNTETVLEPNKEYFWFFRIICDANDNTANPNVAGWIKRVSVASSENLWFDRLEQFAQSPMNHLEGWTQLLDRFELRDLAEQEIVELKPEEEPSTTRQQGNACYVN